MDLNAVISDHLAQGLKGALATIVEKMGSAPRDEGAAMFVTAGGKTFGTIGGGSVEAEACLAAAKVIETGLCRMLRYGMAGRNAMQNDMICGGHVSLFIEPVEERHKEVYDAVSNATKRGTPGFTVTRYSDAGFSKSFLPEAGTETGDRLDEQTKALISASGRRVIVSEGLIAVPILTRSRLYIFGAGHVSQHISRIASAADFDVTVIDDRADYSNSDRFPEARQTIAEDFLHAFDRLSFSGSEYVVIVTRGHSHDALVLEQALMKPARYVGMIGSRRKTAMVLDLLKKKGLDESLLSRVFAPIGLDIGAETPVEIAVSIVAELIGIRRGSKRVGAGLSMKTVEANRPSRTHAPDHHAVLFG